MDSALEYLFMRRPSIDYVSPAICEAAFSSSSGPVIVLNAFDRLPSISGIVFGSTGHPHRLAWNRYPGALCYSVYKLVDELDPNGAYQLIAECISDEFIDLDEGGTYKITAITPDGETPFGAPVVVVIAPPVVLEPLAWWPMEEVGAVNRVDVINGFELEPSMSFGNINNDAGKVNFAVRLYGTNTNGSPFTSPDDFFEYAPTNLLYSASAGMELIFWAKIMPSSNYNFTLMSIIFSGGPQLSLAKSSDFPGVLRLTFIDGSGDPPPVMSIPDVSEGTFHMYRLFLDPSVLQFGIQIDNGAVHVGSAVMPDAGNLQSVAFFIAALDAFSSCDLSVSWDEFSVWPRKLTTSELNTIWNSGNGTTWPLA